MYRYTNEHAHTHDIEVCTCVRFEDYTPQSTFECHTKVDEELTSAPISHIGEKDPRRCILRIDSLQEYVAIMNPFFFHRD